MPLSANLTDVAAYRAYVQDFYDPLITRAFFTPKTLLYSTIHEGIKGRQTLTRLKAAAGKAVAWKSDFVPATDAVSFHPRHIDVTAIKRDVSFTPQDFEATYLGKSRMVGQNAGEDLPFAGQILQMIMNTNAEELENTFWQGVKAGTVTPGTTPMIQALDGFLEILADEIAAVGSPITPVTTPGGAITTANIVALLESMWNTLPAGYKENEVDVYMSWGNFQKYQQGYRADYGKYVSTNKDATVTLDFSQKAMLIPMPGMGTSNRIVMTPRGNLHVAYDSFTDTSVFQMEKRLRQIEMIMDFKVGCQIAQIDEGALVVNDLT